RVPARAAVARRLVSSVVSIDRARSNPQELGEPSQSRRESQPRRGPIRVSHNIYYGTFVDRMGNYESKCVASVRSDQIEYVIEPSSLKTSAPEFPWLTSSFLPCSVTSSATTCCRPSRWRSASRPPA